MTRQDQSLRAAVFTLGCRLNQADTALLCDDLRRHGYRIVPWGQAAELLVVNGCTVTAGAAAKTRKAVHQARRRNPQACIAVVGCDAELDPGGWLADGHADLILGNADKTHLGERLPPGLVRPPQPHLLAALPSTARQQTGPFAETGAGYYPERTRANLKIQEGCDFACSYCIVPRVRGPARSRQWEDTLREAAELRRRGHLELVLTGVNIATYQDGGRDLADLVEAILALDSSLRVRLSSTEPGPVVHKLIALMARERRVCRFLHLPLQYGEDRILAAMNRRYCVAEYAELATAAAEYVPGLGLGSDLIVGFPGETAEAFATCRETVCRLPINHLHVFTFSARQGTPAADFAGAVPADVAASRAAELTRIGLDLATGFARSQVGQTLEIIAEAQGPRGTWEGWSDNYLRVTCAAASGIRPNTLVRVRTEEHLGGRRLRGSRESEP
jgi:threonylcarbamoyladenosine tRNA methylthiotransferase MtaB